MFSQIYFYEGNFKDEWERGEGKAEACECLAGGRCGTGAHAPVSPFTSPVSQCGHLVPTAMVADLGTRFDHSETINPANDGLMVR